MPKYTMHKYCIIFHSIAPLLQFEYLNKRTVLEEKNFGLRSVVLIVQWFLSAIFAIFLMSHWSRTVYLLINKVFFYQCIRVVFFLYICKTVATTNNNRNEIIFFKNFRLFSLLQFAICHRLLMVVSLKLNCKLMFVHFEYFDMNQEYEFY